MVACETLRARQAALLLYGLPPDARGRVLARLSASEVARLQPLLKELTELGVSPSLSRELQQITPSSATPPVQRGTSARERAESLSGADVTEALNACAPVTMAALLRISEWPWKQEVLDRSAELRRVEVQKHMRSDAPSLSPAVAEALCERLCQEVGGLEHRIMRWTR
jgi:hypothetical protein